jgi:hypothetical protein
MNILWILGKLRKGKITGNIIRKDKILYKKYKYTTFAKVKDNYIEC